jgi:hypothetical protein
MRCIKTTLLSMLWNGYNIEKFRPSRGIRQGGPLSPYIYLCVYRKVNPINSYRGGIRCLETFSSLKGKTKCFLHVFRI